MEPPKKILTVPLSIAVAVLITGSMLMLLHWYFASIVMVSALSAIAILYPARFLMKPKKEISDYAKLIMIFFSCVDSIFRLLHLPSDFVFSGIALLAITAWLALEGFYYLKNNPAKTGLIPDKLFISAALLTGIGALLKLTHLTGAKYLLFAGLRLSGADYLLYTGLILSVIWAFKSFYLNRK